MTEEKRDMLVGLGVLRSTEGHERRGRNKIKGGREGRKEGRKAGWARKYDMCECKGECRREGMKVDGLSDGRERAGRVREGGRE